MNKLTIAVDCLGGDLGAEAVVNGAVMAAQAFPNINLVLVGPESEISGLFDTALKNNNSTAYKNRFKILHAPDVIHPSESPTLAFRRKKESSIVVGLKYVKEGNANGFVSAGSTGALLTGATVTIGRQKGIERPALGTLLPTPKGFTLLMDSGANMDAKPSYLLQFAQLGADYMTRCMGIKNPRIGLINVGAEEEKGNAAAKEAHLLLKASDLNFVGNIEGREIPTGAIDVAVCDGFTGNVILKFMEGFAKTMLGTIKEELMATTVSKMGALMAKGAFGRVKKRFDYREVGGAPFLGLKNIVIKAHGSSDALAIKNAVKQCVIFENQNSI